MRFQSVILALACGLVGLAAPPAHAQAPDADRRTLRVLSFNVWGIWAITPSRAERIAAIGPAIAAHAPDLVALQEVWLDEDAVALSGALAQAGLPYARRFQSTWPGHSGLLIASRYPIARTDFVEYEEGTHPHVPWHIDWMAGKGIARIRVQTPAGPVDFANTHVQANYGGTGEYDLVQLAQLLQAAEFLDARRDAPLIVAGDLNVPCGSYKYRAFALRTGLAPTDPACGIDSVSVRPGEGRALNPRAVRSVLTAPVDLADGTHQRLSDHPGVLVEFELRDAAPAASTPLAQIWMPLAREALPKVHAQRRVLSHAQMQHGLLSFVLLQLALLLYALRTGKLRLRAPKHLPMRLLLGAAMASAVWFGYLGLSYAPMHLSALDSVEQRLEQPLRFAARARPTASIRP